MDPRITRLRELARNEAIWEMGRLLKGRFQPAYCGGSEFISVEELHGFIDRITKEMVEGNNSTNLLEKVYWEGNNASRTDASSNSSGISGKEVAEESQQDV